MRFAPVRVVCVVAALATAAGVLAAPALAAAPTWSVVPSPNAPRPNGSLTAVECPAKDVCLAVGSFTDSTGRPALLAEKSTGVGAWQLVPVQQAPRSPVLTGMSCVSATFCLAVGSSGADPAQRSFAEVWDGTAWTEEPTPNVAGAANTGFERVSCLSTAFCMAVGSTSRGGMGTTTPVAAVRRDGAWTVLPGLPATTGTGSLLGVFHGVDCVSSTSCVAVGSSIDSRRRRQLLVESWNGSTWTLARSGGRGEFNAVDCVGTSCTAAGFTGPPGNQYAAAISFTGTTETGGHSFFSLRRSRLGFMGISCLSATLCEAVGPDIFAKTVDGGQWRAPLGPTDGALQDISCRAGDRCIVVGDALQPLPGSSPRTGASYAGLWDGHGWTTQRSADRFGVGNAGWLAVSCASAGACLALDSSPSTSVFAWDGTTWSKVPGPTAPAGTTIHLDDVSCAAPGDCVVVGATVDSRYARTYVSWRRTAGSWTPTPIVVPAHVTPTRPPTVSCAAVTRCELALDGFDTQRDIAVLQGFDGVRWTVQATLGRGVVVSDISCSAVDRCAAAGQFSGRAGVQVWDGTSWSAAAFPTSSDQLLSVSCAPGTTTCAAVGYLNLNPIAFVGTGSTWVETAVPFSRDSPQTPLTAVSCASATSCTATGDASAFFTGSDNAVTYGWDGTAWSLQDTPAAHRPGASLQAVDCPTVAFCVTVGGQRRVTPPPASATVSLVQVRRG